MLIEGQVGPVVAADGTQQQVRQGRDSALVVSDAHGRYYESAARGNVFAASGPPLGGAASSSTAGAMTFAAASTPVGALWNPTGSGKVLSVLRAFYSPVSGTTPPGQVYWYAGITTAITAGTKLTPQATNGLGNQPSGVAYGTTTATAAAALTGQSALPILRAFASSNTIAATGQYAEEIAGEISLQPGTALALAGSVAGSAYLWAFGIVWEEVSA